MPDRMGAAWCNPALFRNPAGPRVVKLPSSVNSITWAVSITIKMKLATAASSEMEKC